MRWLRGHNRSQRQRDRRRTVVPPSLHRQGGPDRRIDRQQDRGTMAPPGGTGHRGRDQGEQPATRDANFAAESAARRRADPTDRRPSQRGDSDQHRRRCQQSPASGRIQTGNWFQNLVHGESPLARQLRRNGSAVMKSFSRKRTESGRLTTNSTQLSSSTRTSGELERRYRRFRTGKPERPGKASGSGKQGKSPGNRPVLPVDPGDSAQFVRPAESIPTKNLDEVACPPRCGQTSPPRLVAVVDWVESI